MKTPRYAAAFLAALCLFAAPAAMAEDTQAMLEDSYKAGYLQTAKQANLRKLPDKKSAMIDQLSGDTLVEVLDTTETGWVQIRVAKTGRKGYIMAELLEPVPSPTPTPTPTPTPSPTPEPTPLYYEETQMGRTLMPTNLRKTPGGQRLDGYQGNERLSIFGEMEHEGELWYVVECEDGAEGFMLAELVRMIVPAVLTEVPAEEVRDKYPVIGCDPIEEITSLEPFEYTQEELAQYRTLTVDDRNEDVLRLKRRLYELGYFAKRNDNSFYTESTADVIRRFQRDNGLPVTGDADPHTQAMLYDDRTLAREGSEQEVKYLTNTREDTLWIQRAETGSHSFYGSVQISLRNNTGGKMTAFGLKIIPYMSDGTPADMADTFAEEIEREYTMNRISIPDGRSYSDFYDPAEDDDGGDVVYDDWVTDEWIEIFGPDAFVSGGGSSSRFPHHFEVSRKIYFSGAQVAVTWYRSGGKNVYIDDDQLVFVEADAGAGDSHIRTLPIEITDEEREKAQWEMGVVTRYVLPVYQSHYGIPQGAWIKSVEENSPAEDAGLKPGDVIAGIGDITILGDATLRKARAAVEPGENMVITFWREGTYYQTELVRPQEEAE